MSSGLSVGQLEALKSGTDSKLESVMGDVGGSVSRRAQRVIDVSDLGGEDEIGMTQVSVGSGSNSNSPGLGAQGSLNANSGMGGVQDNPALRDQGVSSATTGGSVSYLNNPVPASETPWLFNQQMPSVLIKHEKVEHRIMLYLKAQGKSNNEVAQYMGYSDGQVSQITRQPWFLKDLKELLQTEGADLIRRVLEGAGLDSVITLIKVRDDEKTPATVKVQASNSILDRLLGKAKQEVTIERKESPQQKVDRIDTELSVLQAHEAELQQQLSRFKSN